MIKVFISYARKDVQLMRRLVDEHLMPLRRSGRASLWYDTSGIPAGKEFTREISENLYRADVILLLVTPRFLASRFISDVEVRAAMELHEATRARVVPILLAPVSNPVLQKTPFAKLQFLPRDRRSAEANEQSQGATLAEIADEIDQIVDELQEARKLVKIDGVAWMRPDQLDEVLALRDRLISVGGAPKGLIERRLQINQELVKLIYVRRDRDVYLDGYCMLYPIDESAVQAILRGDLRGGIGFRDDQILPRWSDPKLSGVYLASVGAGSRVARFRTVSVAMNWIQHVCPDWIFARPVQDDSFDILRAHDFTYLFKHEEIWGRRFAPSLDKWKGLSKRVGWHPDFD